MTDILNPMPKIPKDSLRPLPKDPRFYGLGYAYPVPKISELPTGEWYVADPLEIKDQGDTDMCPAFSSSEVAEDHEGVIMEPGYSFGKIKQIIGRTDGYGATLEQAMQAGCKYGFLPKSQSPFDVARNGRDFCADWTNWDKVGADDLAAPHKQGSYFLLKGFPYDTFDTIRAAMWQHRDEKSSVEAGSLWYNEWFTSDGVIPKQFSEELGAHAYKIFGQKPINGELYLAIQNSYGPKFGNNGIFYMSRDTVNRIMGLYAPFYGLFMWKDLDKASAQLISQPTLQDRLLRVCLALLYQLQRRFNNQPINP